MPSTPGDTESNFSADYNEVLGSLNALRREIDGGRSPEDEEGDEKGGGELRQRTGHL